MAMQRVFTALTVTTLVATVAVTTARLEAQRDTSSVKQVMLTMTIPASDAIFSAASDPPKNAQAWLELRTDVQTLVESGNLLMTRGLAKDNAAWMEMTRALVTQAQATLKAIDAKSGDALTQASDDVYATCETCYARYLEQ